MFTSNSLQSWQITAPAQVVSYLNSEDNVTRAFQNLNWLLHEANMQLKGSDPFTVDFLACLD